MKTIRHLALALLLSLFASVAMANPTNINTADAQTLADAITGVGQARAEAIVQYREKHGPFKSVDELINVKGIGAKIIEMNREKLTVDM